MFYFIFFLNFSPNLPLQNKGGRVFSSFLPPPRPNVHTKPFIEIIALGGCFHTNVGLFHGIILQYFSPPPLVFFFFFVGASELFFYVLMHTC